MLSAFMQELSIEWELQAPLPQNMPGVYTIPLEESLSFQIASLPQGFTLNSHLIAAPSRNLEEFFEKALLANLFGQGTNGAILGLSEDGKMLTLSRNIDYDITYKEFRDIIEDFINTIDFWREFALDYL